MDEFLEYPKWVKVDGDGDPLMPGHVLCETAEDEAALTAPKKRAAKPAGE